MKSIVLCFLALASFTAQAAAAAPVTPQQWPPFSEVYNLIRAHATNLSEAELQHAAVVGFLNQLSNRVTLLTSDRPADTNTSPLVAKSETFNNDFGYIRIGEVATGLAPSYRKAWDLLKTGKKLEGLVMDLRYADGTDYSEAGKVADQFFAQEHVLFRRGETTFRSTEKTNAVTLPLVVLVNSETTGAAELLAAILHEKKIGLLIGSPPKTMARAFKEVPLGHGLKLRIATSEVAVGDDLETGRQQVEPDLRINLTPEAEKPYYNNPYALAATNALPTNAVAGTNSLFPRHRLNEAELVRMQREGLSIDAETVAPEKPAEQKPVVTDPALARALDILKGLAVVQNRP